MSKINKIDREAFYRRYKAIFGRLTQPQVNGINTILQFVEDEIAGVPIVEKSYGLSYTRANTELADPENLAYFLATVYHETAATFQPIQEYGKGKGRKYGKPDPVTGKTYYGRGYVQLTWKFNYQKMALELNIPSLVDYPDLVMLPAVSYAIASLGMQEGYFTGRELKADGKVEEFEDMRRIINGTDKAREIARVAKNFLRLLSK